MAAVPPAAETTSAADLLVSPAHLAERLAETTVLDVRGEVASEAPRYRADPDAYRAGHVPGAVFVDWRRDLVDRSASVPVQLPRPAELGADAARLGIAEDRPVVAYDDFHGILASRVVWALRAYGHPEARLLDGGLAAWRRARLPLETGERTPEPPERPFRPLPAPRGRLDLDGMRGALADGALVLDARSRRQYAGAETHAARAGHVPGALNVPYRTLLDEDGRLLPPDELRRVLRAAGVDPPEGRRVVAYCNGGVSATLLAHAVALAGGPLPELYDGSWNEWGNRDDTPIET